ncbi:MAG: EAL domain-containing protein [Azonexus sp.]
MDTRTQPNLIHRIPRAAFSAAFEAIPSPCLILETSPPFTIVGANAAYLKATMTQLGNIVGKPLFDIFPDNPDNPCADGVAVLTESLKRVVASGQMDVMPVQRYDIRCAEDEGADYVERYWSPKNVPVVDAQGKLIYLLHIAEDVTDFVKLTVHLGDTGQEEDGLKKRIQVLETEMFQQAKERHEANRRLREAITYLISMNSAYFTKEADLEREIEARRLVERELRDREQQLLMALQIGRIGTVEVDLTTNHVRGSAELAALCGMPAFAFESDIDTLIRERVHPDDQNGVSLRLDEARSSGCFEHEWRTVWLDGTVRWLAGRAAVSRNGNAIPQRLIGVGIDITERKEAETNIRLASQHDPLTGLPNRALFHELAAHLVAGQQRSEQLAALLFIDLDRFKPINDTYGHAVGDAVLNGVALRLAKCVREEDVVGRLGGDEFVAMLGNIQDDENAGRIASHLLENLRQPYLVDDFELNVSPSIGISLFPRDSAEVNGLIQCADSAMYQVKQSGANAYQFYQPDLNQTSQETQRIEKRLRKALEYGEFELVWLPVIDLENGKAVGAEALLRWPAMGISPERFLPMAETMGIMPPLAQWVLNEACRVRQAWRQHGLPDFPVSVNISSKQFRQRDFPRSLTSAMAQGQLHAGDLRLDITEHALGKHLEEAALSVKAIQNVGVGVGLDDFGSGVTSLKSMIKLPLDSVKLDRHFASHKGGSDEETILMDNVLHAADTLGISVIAEGIDSKESLDYLRLHHCTLGQGFLFTHPLSSGEFEEWYKRRAA